MKKKFLTFILCICFIIPAMFCLSACTQTPPDIQFKVENGYVQYYNGESWSNLIAVEDLEGIDGREIEFKKTTTHIQWRYKTNNNSDTWKNLVALTELDGVDGREIEFRKTSTHIQWRYVEASQGADENWTSLVALTELDGKDGKEVEIRKTSTHIQWRYVVTGQGADEGWINLITIEELNGKDATYSTYKITYDYGAAKEYFDNAEYSMDLKSTEWVSEIPTIKEEYQESFKGWFIKDSNKQIKQYDFVGGNATLEAKFDITKNAPAGLYKNDVLTTKWESLVNRNIGIKDTYITNQAFTNNYIDGDFVVANTVTEIRASALSDCDKLTNIIIPNNVLIIGSCAFKNCVNLNKVIIPANASIGTYCFENCSNLIEVSIEDGITDISTGAFKNCTKLENVNIPSTITTIRESSFEGCSALKSINLPNTELTICISAFEGCTSIKALTIPENTIYIGSNAFNEMYNLSIINFNAKNCETHMAVGATMFKDMGLNANSVEINIGKYVRSIPQRLFNQIPYNQENNNSTPVIVNFAEDSKLISIGLVSFEGCNISELILPNGLTSIGNCAFDENANLTKVVMPKSVTNFGNSIFDSELVNIFYLGTEEEWNKIQIDSPNLSIVEENLYFYLKPNATPVEYGNYWFVSDIDYNFDNIRIWHEK